MNQPQQRYPFNFDLVHPVESMPDFQPRHPTPFGNIDGGIGAQGWTFLEFLNKWQFDNYQENPWWEYDRWNQVICFGGELITKLLIWSSMISFLGFPLQLLT